MIARIIRILVPAALLVAVIGCSREPPGVVVYCAVDEHAARPVFDRFTEKTGIPVRPLFDSEVNKTTGLAERLRRERGRPRADLFWSNESVQAGRLAQEGILREGRDGLSPTFIRARVLVCDPARVSDSELPRTWWELAEPRFRGRLAMADPRFGTTGTHLAGMLAFLSLRGESERFDAWCRGLAQNGVRVLPSGNGGVVRAVASGEADFGMTDTDDAEAINESRRHAPLRVLMLRHGEGNGEGPWAMRGMAGVVAGAPHAEAAERLLEFLVSDEAQQILASAAPGFHPTASAEQAGIVDPLRVDPAVAESSLPEALERFFRAVRAPE